MANLSCRDSPRRRAYLIGPVLGTSADQNLKNIVWAALATSIHRALRVGSPREQQFTHALAALWGGSMTPEEVRRRTYYHESGHAVAAVVRGEYVKYMDLSDVGTARDEDHRDSDQHRPRLPRR